MNHIEGSFESVRQADIYYQAWLPDEEVKAVLLVVHGLGEHCGRYADVASHFVQSGYAVYAFDHIGHGKSGGLREYVERFSDFTATLSFYYQMIAGWQPGKSIFILGHSLGGLITSDYLLEHQASFKGAILSGLAIKVSVSPVTVITGKMLAVLFPKMGFWGLDPAGISTDPKEVQAYVDDPLVFHGQTPLRTLAETIIVQQRITADAHKIRLPFIALQGGADRIVDPQGAQILYEGASSADKTIKVYDGLYHDIFHETERHRVLADVDTWLAAHA